MRQRWGFHGRREVQGEWCYLWETYDLTDEDRERGYLCRIYMHPVATFWPVAV